MGAKGAMYFLCLAYNLILWTIQKFTSILLYSKGVMEGVNDNIKPWGKLLYSISFRAFSGIQYVAQINW